MTAEQPVAELRPRAVDQIQWLRRLGAQSPRAWAAAFLAVSAVLSVLLLYLGRGSTFWHDDWTLIAQRPGWTLEAIMAPSSEHWIAVPVLVWKLLFAVFGLHTYVPYLAALVAAHVAVAAALYWYARSRMDDPLALAVASFFLIANTADFGFGATLYYVLAAAFGVWALVLALHPTRRHDVLVSGLLVLAVASSGHGLFFLAVTALALVLAREPRRALLVAAPSVLAYVLWLMAFGQFAAPGDIRLILHEPAILADFVTSGVGFAVANLLGVEFAVGLIVAVVGIVAVAAHVLGRSPLLIGVVAGTAGLIATYVGTGIDRATFGADQAQAPRYLYVPIVFMLIALVDWMGNKRPWSAPRFTGVVGALAVWSLLVHALWLPHVFNFYGARAYETRAAIEVLTEYGGSPALPDDATVPKEANAYLYNLPSARQMRALIEAFGNPLEDSLLVSAGPVPPQIRDQILMMFVGNRLITTRAADIPAGTAPPAIAALSQATAMSTAGCSVIRPAGSAPMVVITIGPAQSVYIVANADGTYRLSPSRFRPPLPDGPAPKPPFTEDPGRELALTAGEPVHVELPDLASVEPWYLAISSPAASDTELCLAAM